MQIRALQDSDSLLFFKDRVVVITEGHSPEVLTKINSVLRRIDLFSKLFSPVISGFIVSFVSLKASAMALALWNMISVWVEYWLFMSVYNGIPALRDSNQRKASRLTSQDQEESQSFSPDGKRSLLHDAERNKTSDSSTEKNWKSKVKVWISQISLVTAWKIYLQQDIVLAGVALALLFFTVLR